MPHRYDVTVRWSDEDRLGHINNSRYLTYTEQARLVWLADSPTGGTVILARSEIDFVRQVHFATSGLLVVQTSVLAVGTRSVRLHQDVFHAADVSTDNSADRARAVARSEHVLVCYDYPRQRSRPWQDKERAWLHRWTERASS